MEYIPWIVVVFCALCASVSDIRNFKVYNRLTMPCFVGAVAFYVCIYGWSGLGFSLAGAALGFGMLFLPYIMGGIGAGDVKFVMAVGAWLGPQLLIPAMVFGSVATGVYSLVLIMRAGGFRDAWLNVQLMFLRLSNIGKHLAFDDEFAVQAVAKQKDRRAKLIPFSAMVSLGVLGTLVVVFWLKSRA